MCHGSGQVWVKGLSSLRRKLCSFLSVTLFTFESDTLVLCKKGNHFIKRNNEKISSHDTIHTQKIQFRIKITRPLCGCLVIPSSNECTAGSFCSLCQSASCLITRSLGSRSDVTKELPSTQSKKTPSPLYIRVYIYYFVLTLCTWHECQLIIRISPESLVPPVYKVRVACTLCKRRGSEWVWWYVCIGIRGNGKTFNGDGNNSGVAIESAGSFVKRNFYIPCQSLLTAGFLSVCAQRMQERIHISWWILYDSSRR